MTVDENKSRSLFFRDFNTVAVELKRNEERFFFSPSGFSVFSAWIPLKDFLACSESFHDFESGLLKKTLAECPFVPQNSQTTP